MDSYAIDGHKLAYHPQRVAAWCAGKDVWETAKGVYPLYVELSPFGGCNHRCTFCALDYLGYAPVAADAAVMAERLGEMGRCGVKSVMFAGEGEPLLAKGLPLQVEAAARAGLDIALTTNAVLLTPQRAAALLPRTRWIKASCNAGTPDTYAAVHGTSPRDFSRVVDNLSRAVAARKEHGWGCAIGVQMLLLPENIAEAGELARICRDVIGADYLVLKPHSQHAFTRDTRYRDWSERPLEAAGDLERLAETFSTPDFEVVFRGRAVARASRDKPYAACGATPFFWAYVASGGDLYACSAYLGDPRFCLGNLREATFRELWEGEGRRRVWEMLRREFDLGACRRNCRMDAVNRYLWRLGRPQPHDAFI